jgi:spore coat polysaccharide biosynthesis protein SpsF
MASTRLYGKALIRIRSKTILEHVVDRVKPSRFIEKFAIATTTNPNDDIIEELGTRLGLPVFRGSESDVLDRCYQTANALDFDPIVRVTADDPLQDVNIIDRAIEIYLESAGKYDLVCNTLNPTYPEGLGAEVISFNSLKKIATESTDQSDREHITTYILNRPKEFRIYNLKNSKKNLASIRLTLDTKEDLELVKIIYDELYDPESYMTMEDIVGYILKHPNLLEVNRNVTRTLRYKRVP